MKITKRQLKRIIKEEKSRLLELGPPPGLSGLSQEWERRAKYEDRTDLETEKKAFMASELTRWYDEFNPEDDGQADLIEDHLSECYDAIYKALVEAWQ